MGLQQWFSAGADFVPQRTFGSIGRQVCLSQLKGATGMQRAEARRDAPRPPAPTAVAWSYVSAVRRTGTWSAGD